MSEQKSFQELVKEMSGRSSVKIMEGKNKGDLIDLTDDNPLFKDQAVTVNDYDIIFDATRQTSYSVFTVREAPDNFYFGGPIITELFNLLDTKALKDQVHETGLKVKVLRKLSKNKRFYYTMEVQ